jgi:hypothetical protein
MVPKTVKEYQQDQGRFCDVCGKQIGDNSWDRTEIMIEAKIGDSYPEGDFREVQRLDLCPAHWVEAKNILENALNVKFRVWDIEESEPGEEVK